MTRLAPIGGDALHLCIDMQRLFAEPTPWQVPSLPAILPNVLVLADAMAGATLYARFLLPADPESAPGRWRDHYRRWPDVLGAVAARPELLDLVPELAARAAPRDVVDKWTYSLLAEPGPRARIAASGARTLVLSGVETDACVLATLLGAVDLGCRTILVVDAVTSADLTAHRAVVETLLPRLPVQVETAETATVLAALAG